MTGINNLKQQAYPWTTIVKHMETHCKFGSGFGHVWPSLEAENPRAESPPPINKIQPFKAPRPMAYRRIWKTYKSNSITILGTRR